MNEREKELEKRYRTLEKEFSLLLDRLRKDLREIDELEHVSKSLSDEVDRILYTEEPDDPIAYVNYRYTLFSKIGYIAKTMKDVLGDDGIVRLGIYHERLKKLQKEVESLSEEEVEDYMLAESIRELNDRVMNAYTQLSVAVDKFNRVNNYMRGTLGNEFRSLKEMSNANKELSKYMKKYDVKNLIGKYYQARDYVEYMLEENMEFFKEMSDPVENLKDIIESEKPREDSVISDYFRYKASLEHFMNNSEEFVRKIDRELEIVREKLTFFKTLIAAIEILYEINNLRDPNPLTPILTNSYKYVEKLTEAEEELKNLKEYYLSRFPEAMRLAEEELKWIDEKL